MGSRARGVLIVDCEIVGTFPHDPYPSCRVHLGEVWPCAKEQNRLECEKRLLELRSPNGVREPEGLNMGVQMQYRDHNDDTVTAYIDENEGSPLLTISVKYGSSPRSENRYVEIPLQGNDAISFLTATVELVRQRMEMDA